MNTQSAQTPIQRESIALTLTPEEQDALLESMERDLRHSRSIVLFRISKRLNFLKSDQSGDACRHPVQSPDAVGQDGTNQFSSVCPRCNSVTGVLLPEACCSHCYGTSAFYPSEFMGQGDNHE